MKRVVVTGLGILSSIGVNKEAVVDALRRGTSGIRHNQEYADLGLRCHVDAPIPIEREILIDRKLQRFMGDAALYGFLAMEQAVVDAGLTADRVSHPRTGLIVGSGGASHRNTVEAADLLRKKGLRGVGPYRVSRTMGSTTSANLATTFRIRGISYT